MFSEFEMNATLFQVRIGDFRYMFKAQANNES